MLLSELNNGESGIITKVRGRGAFRKRITEMGFVQGKRITVIKESPLRDPVQYNLMDYEVSLRRSEATLIEVLAPNEAASELSASEAFDGTITDETFVKQARQKSKIINVAFVGNPNSGKTTLFNFASNSHEHVGNYAGVTVESKLASFKHRHYKINVIDLPGTYSLTAYSPEELYVRKYIVEQMPDVVVNVIDASNIERNMYLTTQLIDMDIRVVAALNMYDELQSRGDKFDHEQLGKMIGIPMVPTIGAQGKGIRELFDTVIEVYEEHIDYARHIHINYGESTETAIKAIQSSIRIPENLHFTQRISSRFAAIKLLENDNDITEMIQKCANADQIKTVVEKNKHRLESELKTDSETAITDAKYGFIAGALRQTFRPSEIRENKRTRQIDNILTHRWLGVPVFLFFMWLTFQATFTLGEIPMNGIDALVAWIGDLISHYMPDGMLKDLLVDGVVGGVGGVIVFLPNIMILFLFISIMEDSGYMARAAFIVDRVMRKIGLQGKSFIPLIMGFGCNVPAIMATRTLQNRNDRMITMLILPFMSCSARLPVHLVVIGAVFPTVAGTMLFGIYAIGIALSVVTALMLKKTVFRTGDLPFVMELPPYRVPTLKATARHTWNKGVQYLQKMGGVILVASIIIWALGYFPRTDTHDNAINETMQQYETRIAATSDTLVTNNLLSERDTRIEALKLAQHAEQQQNSYIGRMGRFIEPAIEPLGFDWKMGVSILTGIAAKEIVVSTMGVLYRADEEADENSESLKTKLSNEQYTTGAKAGQKVFTPLAAFSFLVFILIYFPCVAVVAAIRKESAHWKWGLFIIFFSTGVAWLLSFAVYQIGSML